jgi:glutathionylspermidine synthase
MERLKIEPRPDWQKIVESQGLYYHSLPSEQAGHSPEKWNADNLRLYWDESTYYKLESSEIDAIEEATYWLNQYCLQAVDYIIKNNLFAKVGVPESHIEWVKQSWDRDEHTIYGRFDFCFNGKQPKLLEYNADTPTGLLEAAVIQWFWYKDKFSEFYDQYNSIHDKLMEIFKTLHDFHEGTFYFAALAENLEDFMTVNYLRDVAMQNKWQTEYINIEDIGWHDERQQFVDNKENTIKNIFKLYPWEWMVREQFADKLLLNTCNWFEAPWKTLLSNKGILVVLHEMFPESPYILPASWEPMTGSHVRKPLHGREGANVSIMQDNNVISQSDGDYGEPFIYQETKTLPNFDGNFPVIGSWLINGYAAGIGIREDSSEITKNTSRFVPHIFTK